MRVVWAGFKGMSSLERAGLEGEGVAGVPPPPGSDSLALDAWLGQELELRGIDAMIYTRYILSLLQQEWPDLEEEVAAITLARKNHATRPNHPTRHAKKKGRSPLALSAEKIKKLAAIQCLLDVSEEDSDIEKLVEELYSKLQQQQYKENCGKIECSDSSHKHKDSCKSEDSDPAERYYAAFPALSNNTNTLKTTTVLEGKPWAKVAGSSFRTTDTSQDKPLAKNTRGRSSSPNPTYRRKPVFVVPKVNLGRSKSEARSIGSSPVRDSEYKQSSQEWIASLWETVSGKMWLERVMQMMRGAGEVTELKEDMSWYTQPLEMLVPQSPLATQRLYKRKSHPVFYFDFRFSIQDENGNTNKEAREKLDNDPLARYISQLRFRLEQELSEEEPNAVDCDDDDDDDVVIPPPSEFIYEETDQATTPTNDGSSTGAANNLPSPTVTLNISHCSSNADLEATPITDESFIWALNNSFTDNSDTEEALETGFKRAREAEEAFNRVKQLEETKKLEEAKQSREVEMKLTGKMKEDAEAHILALEENVLNKCKETILDQALEEVLNVVEETDDQGPESVKTTFEDVNISMDNEVLISCPDPFVPGDPTIVSQADEYLLISRAKEAEEAFNKVKMAEEAICKKDVENCMVGIIVSSADGEMSVDSFQKSPRLSSGSEEQDQSTKLSAELSPEDEVKMCNDDVQDDWETSIKAAIRAAFETTPDDELQEEAKGGTGVDKLFNMGQKDHSGSSLFDYSGFSDDFSGIGMMDGRYSEEEGTGSLSAAVEEAFHRVDSMSDSINLETTSCSLDDDDDDDIDLNISKLWQLSSPIEDGDVPKPLPYDPERSEKFNREAHDIMKYVRDEEDDPNEDILNVRPIFTVGDDAVSDMYSPPASLRNSPMHNNMEQTPAEPMFTRELHPLNLELDLARPMYLPCSQSPLHMWLPMLSCEICLGSACNCHVASLTWENCLDVLGKRMTPWGNRATPWGHRGTTPWTPVVHGSLFGPLFTAECMYDDDYSQSLSHSLNMLLSPNQDGRLTSQLWDVNVQGRFDFEPPPWESSSTLDSIQKYLFNLNISIQGSTTSSFIQGGLYDSSLLPEAAIWQQRVDMDDLFTFMDEAWHTSRPEQIDSSSLESLDQLELPSDHQLQCTECHHGPIDGRSIKQNRIKLTPESLEFMPSENTAFTASIPRRTAVLHHVQSEPILNVTHRPPPTARLLQVKLLYKSETNIFTQLGMVAPVGVPCIEVAPTSHFRPIRTPFDGQQVDPNAYKTEDVVSPLNEEDAWRILGRKSNYQFFRHYIEPEENEFIPKFKVEKEREKSTQTEGDGDYYDNKSVLEVMFTSDIQSELEISPADAERLVEDSPEMYDGSTESRESPEVSSDYESMGADVSSEDLSGLPLAQLWSGEEDDSAVDQTSEGPQTFSSIWSYTGKPGGLPHVPNSTLNGNVNVTNVSVANSTDGKLSHSFSSAFKPCGQSPTPENSDVPDARNTDTTDSNGSKVSSVGHQQVSFIHLGKMESQHGRTDYNVVLEMDASPEHSWSTIDDDTHCCGHSQNADLCYDDYMQNTTAEQNTKPKNTSHEGTSVTDDPGLRAKMYEKIAEASFVTCLNQEQPQHPSAASLRSTDGKQKKSYRLEPGAQQLSKSSPGTQRKGKKGASQGSVGKEPGFTSSQPEGGPPPIYSSDLEKQWLSTETSFAVQVPKPGQRHRLGSRQKPCSFYMEGNCRRVDCKFAHDTSNITCRFWEEGACFKGITCPFLHGYYKEKLSPKRDDLDNFYIADTEFPELVQLHNKKEEGRSSSHTSEDSESAVPIIHRRKQQKSWMKGYGKFQKNKGT